jgi:hypothetical protein
MMRSKSTRQWAAIGVAFDPVRMILGGLAANSSA